MIRYTYAIERQDGQEIVAFHWEGDRIGAVPYPHVHINLQSSSVPSELNRKVHIPTGHVAVEDIVYFAIQELWRHTSQKS